MRVLTEWIAQRSGAHITILATNERGERVKISKVVCINADTISTKALCATGEEYRLLPPAQDAADTGSIAA